MRASALVLLLATLAGGCGSSSSLDDTQPVVTIPDDSETTSPVPPGELSRDPTSTELDGVGGLEPPRTRIEAAPIMEYPAERHYPAKGHCVMVECP